MGLLEPGYPRERLKSQLLWFLFWAGLTGIGAFLKPNTVGHGTHEQLGLPPCPSVMLFDRPCPGCGLTTSWSALIHGDIGFAFHAHPFGPILYLAFTISAWMALYGWAKGLRFATDSRPFNWIVATVAVSFFTFGMVRMAVTPHFATQNERLSTLLQAARR